MDDLRSIRTGIVSINELSAALEEFLNIEFKFDRGTVRDILAPYLASLRPELFVLIEYPYVDKVYRDSFYTYYSSKHTKYERDCVRLTFFDAAIDENSFFSEEG